MVRRGLRIARSRARGGQVARIARAAALRAVQRQAEKKQKEMELTGTIAQSGADLNPVSISTGTSATQRIGDKCSVTGMYYKLIAEHNYNNTQHEMVRVIMYIPKNTTDSMSTEVQPPGVNDNIDFNKYTVLYDRKVCLNQYTPCHQFLIKKRWHKKGLGLTFDGNGAGDITKNKVQIYIVSNVSNSANYPRYQVYGQTWFTDL